MEAHDAALACAHVHVTYLFLKTIGASTGEWGCIDADLFLALGRLRAL